MALPDARPRPSRVLVTGATGNVGTALLRRLAREGVAVTGVARRVPRPEDSPAAGARWHGIDLGRPSAPDLLREAVAGADAVVHLAWQIQPTHDEERLVATNVEGTRAVARAALDAGVPHLVHLSSLGVYAPVPAGRPKEVVGEDWPRTGVPTSPYSRQKAAAEQVLDEVEGSGGDLVVTRVRPGLVMQREAGAEITRYFAGPLVPAAVLGRLRLPVLPLPAELVFQAVHADDLADALWRLLVTRLPGAVNVAADPPLGPDDLARALGAGRSVRVPLRALRALAAGTWRAHLQPTDAGWVDLAAGVPLMSTERARTELGWSAATPATAALADLVAGMRSGAGSATPPLRARTLLTGRREPAS